MLRMVLSVFIYDVMMIAMICFIIFTFDTWILYGIFDGAFVVVLLLLF